MQESNLIPDGGMKDLSRTTVRGGVVVFGSMILQKTVGLGLLAVLARLLTPEDYGLLGMVFAFTAFLQVFADLGLTMATVQRADLTRAQISTLFWVNLGFGGLLAGMAAVSSPAIAWFYGEPELLYVTLWCSLGFAIGSLGTQHTALLMRRMRFVRLAVCDLAGLLAGGCVGIWMALRGQGVYALVGQTLAQISARTAFAWMLAAWVPGPPVRGSGVRQMLRFGGYLTGFNFVNYFARNMDKVLLGRFWGAGPLGYYTRAYGLMTFPIIILSQPLTRVMVPSLSALQCSLPRFREVYSKVFMYVAILSFPFMVMLFLLADDVITIVYGSQWKAAAQVFRVLCIAGFWQALYNSAGWVYTASGRTDRLFRWGLVGSPIICVGCALGLPWGAVGVAVGYAAAMCALALPYFSYAWGTVGLGMWPVIGSLWQSATASCVLAVTTGVLLFSGFAETWSPPLRAGTFALVGLAAYGFALLLLRPRLISEVREVVRTALAAGEPRG